MVDFASLPAAMLMPEATDDSGNESGRALYNSEPCLVCQTPTKGMHFAVVSCRACAAFFRRSVKARKVYRCRRGTRDCDLSKSPNGKPICRFCRLQMCYKVGMRMESVQEEHSNVQGTRPSSSSVSSSHSSPPTEPQPSGESEFVMGPGPNHRVTRGNRICSDITGVIARIKEVLRSTERRGGWAVSNGVHLTPLQQTQIAFGRMREVTCPLGQIDLSLSYDKLIMYPFLEKYAFAVAEMMMSCEPFVHFCFEDKFRLFKHTWPLVHELERIFSSIELFGTAQEDYRFLLTDSVAVDLARSKVYASHVDPSKLEDLLKFCFPLRQNMFEMLMNPMKELQVTQFEFCYMIALIMFSVTEVRGLSPDTKLQGKHFLDQFANELHNYYTYDQHLCNYAARHAKLIRLIACAQQHTTSIRDHMVMAKIFDIFICDIYESELFE